MHKQDQPALLEPRTIYGNHNLMMVHYRRTQSELEEQQDNRLYTMVFWNGSGDKSRIKYI